MDSRLVLFEHWGVSEGRQRQFYPVEEKRQMVEQTLEPDRGTSATEHGR